MLAEDGGDMPPLGNGLKEFPSFHMSKMVDNCCDYHNALSSLQLRRVCAVVSIDQPASTFMDTWPSWCTKLDKYVSLEAHSFLTLRKETNECTCIVNHLSCSSVVINMT